MRRPDHISNEDILRWSDNIDNDPLIPKSIAESAIMREVCYAGLYLAEELSKLGCPEHLLVKIQSAAGALSFGRDIWDTHIMILDAFKNNDMDFTKELSQLN